MALPDPPDADPDREDSDEEHPAPRQYIPAHRVRRLFGRVVLPPPGGREAECDVHVRPIGGRLEPAQIRVCEACLERLREYME